MKKKILLIGIILIIILLISLGILVNSFFCPQINLKGGKVITINYKSKYIEPGYEASYKDLELSDDVKVKGKVNSKKLGNYKIIYSVKYNNHSTKVVRKVQVRDIESPKIELSKEKVIDVCPGTQYEPEKYKAYDNYDGDVTKNVHVIKRENLIRYSVMDRSGNYQIITKKLRYRDTEKPELSLDGDLYQMIDLNSEYKESGYKASDNCGGDITKNVKISGNVDTSQIGKYELKYEVSDSSSNTVSKTRVVNVYQRGMNGSVYLTFDDGPKSGTTNVILDILKEEGVKATFFVTNGGPDELIKREYDEGHTVALHTSTHNYAYIYSSVDNYFADLDAVHQRVLNITGYDSRIIRFPGGSSNTVSRRYQMGIMSTLTKEVLNRGYQYYDWNISSGDAGETTDKDQVVQNVTSRLSHDRVNIVLMHDIKPYTRDAIKEIIEYGKANGFIFDKIDISTEMMVQKVNN